MLPFKKLSLAIAQAKMEYIFQDLKERDVTTLDLDAYGTNNSGADSDFSDFTVTVELSDYNHPHHDQIQADVTVTWDTKGGQTSIAITSLVTDLL